MPNQEFQSTDDTTAAHRAKYLIFAVLFLMAAGVIALFAIPFFSATQSDDTPQEYLPLSTKKHLTMG